MEMTIGCDVVAIDNSGCIGAVELPTDVFVDLGGLVPISPVGVEGSDVTE